jgi:hypothetical protein
MRKVRSRNFEEQKERKREPQLVSRPLKSRLNTPCRADTFAPVRAVREKACIINGDPEFKKVENFAEIHWLF